MSYSSVGSNPFGRAIEAARVKKELENSTKEYAKKVELEQRAAITTPPPSRIPSLAVVAVVGVALAGGVFWFLKRKKKAAP